MKVALIAASLAAASLAALAPSPPVDRETRERQASVLLDSTLRGLEPLMGSWGAPLSVTRVPPNHVVHHYAALVGGKALRIRESFPLGRPDDAELDGLVFWNVATQRIEFVAVAGKGVGQGRSFVGEYHVRADGGVERVYDVHYRTAADTPGEELGGTRRRYREIYRAVGKDSIEATLDWWLKGQWQPFGPGKYLLVRKAP